MEHMTDAATEVAERNGFLALGLDAALVNALTALGYEEPTAIQREAIPPLLDGHDVLGQAATGTGKTAAFALPLLQRIGATTDRPTVRGLILVPTRELAMQVAEAVHKYGKGSNLRVLPIYGGQSVGLQLRALERGVDVVVATPGRALDHIRRGTLKLDNVKVLVLDEADEMLDMGFADELEAILESVPETRQTALFSATMAKRILTVAKRHLKDPVRVTIATEKIAPGATARVREVAYIVQRRDKAVALARVLDMEAPTAAIVFCRTRTEVDELTERLGGRGYSAEALHGGLSQEQRDRILRRFRDGSSELLIATDVAARGLDIDHVTHVVNFDVPSSPDAYVHRIGRTGRAGREGVAITLAEAREHRLLRNIELHSGRKISVEALPTIHDLRARKLELTRSALEEALEGESSALDRYRSLVEALAQDHDVIDLAAAAVMLADRARDGDGADEEEDIAIIPPPQLLTPPKRLFKAENRAESRPEFKTGDITRIYVGLGRRAGVRPADLVGAIANEAGIPSRHIGPIEITDMFSLVGVPENAADDIIAKMRKATIRGKKANVRRDREPLRIR
jgi:ATP-dependent RNA helicase DeaD